MAKKNKDDAPNSNNIPNRDIIQRLNFLYQASSYLNCIGSGEAFSEVRTGEGKDQAAKEGITTDTRQNLNGARKRRGQRTATTHDLSQSYVKSMKVIGQKTNVKLDPSVKRTMCKGCNTLLMPGVTAKVRVKPLPSHGHAVIYTCKNCSFSRRIPAPPTKGPGEPSSSEASKKAVEPMNVDAVDALLDTVKEEAITEHARGKQSKQVNQAKKKPVKRRPPPFFERPEHILFVGNDRVDRTPEGSEPH